MSVEKELKEIKKKYKDIMPLVEKALTKKKIPYTKISNSEIKAQASQKKIAEIVCHIPEIKVDDIPIVLDIVEAKKNTYIRKK